MAFDSYSTGTTLAVYFKSSRWIFGEGHSLSRRRVRIPASREFGIRDLALALASALNRDRQTFEYVWVVAAGLIYLYALFRVAGETSWLATLAWLGPARIYLALFRFDIYPAAAMLLAMMANRRGAYIEGAIWIGIAAALKGFALFLGPAFFVFIFYQRGLKAAIYCTGIVMAPTLLSLLVTLIFAGWEGTLAPFELQVGRNFNGRVVLRCCQLSDRQSFDGEPNSATRSVDATGVRANRGRHAATDVSGSGERFPLRGPWLRYISPVLFATVRVMGPAACDILRTRAPS